MDRERSTSMFKLFRVLPEHRHLACHGEYPFEAMKEYLKEHRLISSRMLGDLERWARQSLPGQHYMTPIQDWVIINASTPMR